jgi:hypothetical protein
MSELVNPPAVVDSNKAVVSAADAKANPFKAIALLLESVRESLEGVKTAGKAPRWIRIVRIREFQGSGDYISKGVIPAVNGFSTALLHLMNLTLQAKDLLAQADSAKALWEVSADLLKTVTTDEFATSIAQVYDPAITNTTNPLSSVGSAIDVVSKFVDRIPSPEDLELIGGELFRLLSIELLPLDESGLGKTTEKHININTSGKLRLIQMGLKSAITVRGLGTDKKGELPVIYLGSRRLWKTADLPTKAVAQWGDAKKAETVYEFNFAATTEGEGADLTEANDLLEKLGYVEPAVAAGNKKAFTDELAKRLRTFQVINGLTVNGKLDNSTINRLLHFNFETKSIQRAIAFEAGKLPNGFDNSKDIPASA